MYLKVLFKSVVLDTEVAVRSYTHNGEHRIWDVLSIFQGSGLSPLSHASLLLWWVMRGTNGTTSGEADFTARPKMSSLMRCYSTIRPTLGSPCDQVLVAQTWWVHGWRLNTTQHTRSTCIILLRCSFLKALTSVHTLLGSPLPEAPRCQSFQRSHLPRYVTISYVYTCKRL